MKKRNTMIAIAVAVVLGLSLPVYGKLGVGGSDKEECPEGQVYDNRLKECVDLDNDGEITPVPEPTPEDIDGDGILNEDDPDIDGDGILNEDDGDADGDGIEDESGLPQIQQGRLGWQEVYIVE